MRNIVAVVALVNVALLSLGPMVLLRDRWPNAFSMSLAGIQQATDIYSTYKAAILILACKRPSETKELIGNLLKQRRSSPVDYSIVVSLGCDHNATRSALAAVGADIASTLHFYKSNGTKADRDWASRQRNTIRNYCVVGVHYKWAVSMVLGTMAYDYVVILEDDLKVSPDFLQYMSLGIRLLDTNRRLYSVSAMNVHGRNGSYQYEPFEDSMHRLWKSDFRIGWGWLLSRRVWLDDLGGRMPARSCDWDGWFGRARQRRGRYSIRPEVSRVQFGTAQANGASGGLFFKPFLRHIQMATAAPRVPIYRNDTLQQQLRENGTFDTDFDAAVRAASLLNRVENPVALRKAVHNVSAAASMQIHYNDLMHLRRIMKSFGLLNNALAGIVRNQYRGIVPFYAHKHRVYLVPSKPWKGYTYNENKPRVD